MVSGVMKSVFIRPSPGFGTGIETIAGEVFAVLPNGARTSWSGIVDVPSGYLGISAIKVRYKTKSAGNLNLQFLTSKTPATLGGITTDSSDVLTAYAGAGTSEADAIITIPSGAYNVHTLTKGCRLGVTVIRDTEISAVDTYEAGFYIKEIEVVFTVGSVSAGEVAAASNAIVTLDEIKNFLAIPLVNDEHDDFLQEWINKKSNEVEEEVGFKVVPQVLTEIGDGDGTNQYTPHHYPIYAVGAIGADPAALLASVQIRNSAAESWADAVTVADYIISSDRDPWIELYGGAVFPAGRNTVKLIYQPGFNPVPEKLKEAVFLKVVLKAKESGRSIGDGRFGYQSKSTGEGGGTRSTTYKDLEDHIKKLIQPYKRIV